MNREKSIKSWEKMWEALTNPELREKAKQEAERIKRKEDKRSDTGL